MLAPAAGEPVALRTVGIVSSYLPPASETATELTAEPLASSATTRAPAIAALLVRSKTRPLTTTGAAHAGLSLACTCSHTWPLLHPVLALGSQVLSLPPHADAASPIRREARIRVDMVVKCRSARSTMQLFERDARRPRQTPWLRVDGAPTRAVRSLHRAGCAHPTPRISDRATGTQRRACTCRWSGRPLALASIVRAASQHFAFRHALRLR